MAVSPVQRGGNLLHPEFQIGRECLLYVGEVGGSVFPLKCYTLAEASVSFSNTAESPLETQGRSIESNVDCVALDWPDILQSPESGWLPRYFGDAVATRRKRTFKSELRGRIIPVGHICHVRPGELWTGDRLNGVSPLPENVAHRPLGIISRMQSESVRQSDELRPWPQSDL